MNLFLSSSLSTLVDKIKPPVMRFSSSLGRKIALAGIALAVFVVGLVGNRLNSVYTLRLALASSFVILLLRYPYALVITWVLISAVVSDNIPILTNNNILTGLTVPTLLLVTTLPVGALFKRMPTLWFLLIYLMWVFAGICVVAISTRSFPTSWLTDLDYLVVAMLAIHTLTAQRRLHRVIDVLILGGTFVSLFGIYGYITRQNGVTDPTTSLFRIFSIFAAAPVLALFLSIVIPLALYRAFTLRGWKQVGPLLSVLLLLTAALLTFSRGAFISVPLSIVILILFLPSRKLKMTFIICMAGLAVGMLLMMWVGGIPLFSRFLNQDVGTFNGRTLLWQALLDHFDPKQLFGYGLNASNDLLASLQVRLNGELIATAPSNLFIATLYDHGIIGLGLLLVMLMAVLISIIKGILRTKGEQHMLFSVALAIFVSVLLQLFEVDDFWTGAIGVYFWVIMALPFVHCWERVEKASNEDDDIGDKVTDMQIETSWWMRKRDSMLGFALDSSKSS